MASSELLVSEGKKGVSSTVPPKPQQHKRMPSTLQGEEDLFYLLFLACRFYKLLDVLYGSSVALIIAPLCVWLLGAARCPWPHYDPHFLHQKDYAHLFRKQFTWGRNVSAFSLLVLRTTLILNLVQILVFGRHMTINMMILNTLIFALGPCGVRLSRARGGDIVTVRGGTCSTTTGRHGAQPQLDEEKSLGVDSGCLCSSQGLEQQVRRTADVPRSDLRDSAPASAAASSSPPCKNNTSESTACRTSTGSHPHLDAEAEPCGIDSGHSSSQSTGTGTGTAQQAMLAYACSTKDEDQMPVRLIAPSSTQAGGYPEVFLDSGASFHITGFDEALQNREHMTGSVFGISGTALPITGQGSIMGTPFPIWLDKVRYVQGLPRLIVSVSQLTRARSARVVFEPYCCRVERMSDNCTIGQGKMVGDLYTLEFLEPD